MEPFYSLTELVEMGFRSIGSKVRLSRKTSVYGASRIHLGDHSRIDDFCVLSAGAGGIVIGHYVHLAPFCSAIGGGEIVFGDFSGLSSRVSIYSSNDDYSGASLTNPAVPAEWTNVTHAPVRLGRHVIVGAGSVVLPGVTLGEGAAVGAMSLVKRDCEPFGVYFGTPARRVAARKRDLLDIERRFLAKAHCGSSDGG